MFISCTIMYINHNGYKGYCHLQFYSSTVEPDENNDVQTEPPADTVHVHAALTRTFLLFQKLTRME